MTLKAECLQRAGSFKLRGALSKIAALAADARGLVTASAGNHGRAVAYAARARGVACDGLHAARRDRLEGRSPSSDSAPSVHLEGDSVDEALALAAQRARRGDGAAFVHPFDDVDVIAGQGRSGSSCSRSVPDLARVIVPVGGGGLASGSRDRATARAPPMSSSSASRRARARRSSRALGRRAAWYSPRRSRERRSPTGSRSSSPGGSRCRCCASCSTTSRTVSEDEIADAIVFLAERAKLVAEGAGRRRRRRAPERALRRPCDGTDRRRRLGRQRRQRAARRAAARHETEEGRRVRIFTRVPDRPGGLAELLGLDRRALRANVLSVEHRREAVPLHLRETAVELTLETRGPGHTDEVLAALQRRRLRVDGEVAGAARREEGAGCYPRSSASPSAIVFTGR